MRQQLGIKVNACDAFLPNCTRINIGSIVPQILLWINPRHGQVIKPISDAAKVAP
jgi:hypothetical protein